VEIEDGEVIEDGKAMTLALQLMLTTNKAIVIIDFNVKQTLNMKLREVFVLLMMM
jgi:hypothetical protein